MSMRTSRLARSMMLPFSASTWPCTARGVPSGAISARTLADSGKSLSMSPWSRRSASRISRAETLRASMPTARMPSLKGRMAADKSHGAAGFSDLTRNTTPPCFGRVEADVDVGEAPVLAVALVVDGEIAVLEAEFAQVVAVEARKRRARRSRRARRQDFQSPCAAAPARWHCVRQAARRPAAATRSPAAACRRRRTP